MRAYIKLQTPFKTLTCLQVVRLETRWHYLRPHKLFRGFSCLVICVVYHPPSSENNALIEQFTRKLDVALSMNPNRILFLMFLTFLFDLKVDILSNYFLILNLLYYKYKQTYFLADYPTSKSQLSLYVAISKAKLSFLSNVNHYN